MLYSMTEIGSCMLHNLPLWKLRIVSACAFGKLAFGQACMPATRPAENYGINTRRDLPIKIGLENGQMPFVGRRSNNHACLAWRVYFHCLGLAIRKLPRLRPFANSQNPTQPKNMPWTHVMAKVTCRDCVWLSERLWIRQNNIPDSTPRHPIRMKSSTPRTLYRTIMRVSHV